jgi:hypothetical protein
MTHADQKGMIRELMDHSRKMTRAEDEELAMFVRRDKDDEDLDAISRRRLIALYQKYVPKGKYLL